MLLRTILRDRARTSRIASLISKSESSFAVSGVEEDAPPPPRNVDVGKRPRRRLKQPLPLPEAIALIRVRPLVLQREIRKELLLLACFVQS